MATVDWQRRIDEAVRDGKERLDLYTCDLRDDDMKYVVDNVFLNEQARVTRLNLNDNKIGPAGARLLSEGLKENKTVQQLFLTNNQIGDKGMIYLSAGLRQNKTLYELFLFNNEIGPEGVEFLSEALKANESLQRVGLSGNKIGDKGMEFLVAAAEVNTTLSHWAFRWENTDASDFAKQAVLDALSDLNVRKAARKEYLLFDAARMVKSAAKR